MSAREAELEFGIPVESEDDEIDRLNKKSFWYVYAGIGVWYVAMMIWFGFSIHTANVNGASHPEPVWPLPAPSWQNRLGDNRQATIYY